VYSDERHLFHTIIRSFRPINWAWGEGEGEREVGGEGGRKGNCSIA